MEKTDGGRGGRSNVDGFENFLFCTLNTAQVPVGLMSSLIGEKS